MIIFSFLLFLLIFIFIGALSTLKKKKNSKDYLLASQSVKPWLVALSAVATTNSGYMFIGLIGYTYTLGLSSLWLMAGWIFGDFLASLFCHEKIREVSESKDALSFSGIISKWSGRNFKNLRLVCGLITIIFLGTYAAAQLSAGSKALHILFGWNYAAGAIIGALMVVIYCFVGGIRASIWTNSAQSFVMIFAISMLLFCAIEEIGGLSQFNIALHAVSPHFMDLFPNNLHFGLIGIGLFILGWIIAGFGVIGQPHIMLSFMTMEKPSDIKRVRLYYYSWYTAFSALTIIAGLAARILIPDTANFDPELALPKLSQQLLPEFLVGLVLAALFAATMSTADSQILSCSAAITHDLKIKSKNSYLFSKFATVIMAAIALLIALFGNESVFDLVLIAWSALASAFAPLISVLCFNQKPKEKLSIAMVLSGLLAAILWRKLGFNEIIYEAAAGLFTGFAVFGFGKIMGFVKEDKK